jgi:hypothetical protein
MKCPYIRYDLTSTQLRMHLETRRTERIKDKLLGIVGEADKCHPE